ncbi:MAG TPA: undecaprenyl-diphosphate phosphatase [Thermoclostridium caenicola]|uniref:undecaprenyl-diphosphate phosphatase n=1 Tax=Thermoclostridium caenicola TaxID=659425 RepID=UPI002BD6D408|nr:undecaprenyl-diphosphate phosphatase [Thermoclostridium caenicola]HPO76124.1 undecaprenyl-diphosphate phosphatase [Thermoclostridium caenicola]
MTLIQAILLGIIQGITEFLPISSSGHLVLFEKTFGVAEPTLTFGIVVHLGTLLAVFAVFWKDVASILRRPFQRLTLLLIVGTIPTGIIGVVFKDFFESLFASGKTLGFEFFVTGLVLFFAENINRGYKDVEETSLLDAAFVGVMQGAAILPAISRSGLTISGALFRDMDRDFAARFSFLLSIPAILGAAVFDMKDVLEAGVENLDSVSLGAGFIFAAIFGYISIKYMIGILKKGKMRYFSYYVFVLGALILIDQYLTHIFF